MNQRDYAPPHEGLNGYLPLGLLIRHISTEKSQ